MVTAAPTAERWREQLASQTILTVSPEAALTTVRAAWAAATGNED